MLGLAVRFEEAEKGDLIKLIGGNRTPIAEVVGKHYLNNKVILVVKMLVTISTESSLKEGKEFEIYEKGGKIWKRNKEGEEGPSKIFSIATATIERGS